LSVTLGVLVLVCQTNSIDFITNYTFFYFFYFFEFSKTWLVVTPGRELSAHTKDISESVLKKYHKQKNVRKAFTHFKNITNSRKDSRPLRHWQEYHGFLALAAVWPNADCKTDNSRQSSKSNTSAEDGVFMHCDPLLVYAIKISR
jgi:hypothetical protein